MAYRRLRIEQLETRNLFSATGGVVASEGTLYAEGDQDRNVFELSLPAATLTINGLPVAVDFAVTPHVQIVGHAGEDVFQFTAEGWAGDTDILVEFLGGAGDSATLTGTAGTDVAELWPSWGLLRGDGFTVTVNSQDIQVHSAGGADRADLFDSARNDQLVAVPYMAQMSSDDYRNEAWRFPHVYAHSNSGGTDTADLYDSRGDDRFFAYPGFAKLLGSDFYVEAIAFDSVMVRSTSGGQDRADLYGSPLDDRLFGSRWEGAMYGPGYYNHAQVFDYIYAHAGEGGFDSAELFGTGETDHYYSRLRYGYLTSEDYYNLVSEFEAVAVRIDPAADILDTAAVDYVFELLGSDPTFTFAYFSPGTTTAEITFGDPPLPVALEGDPFPHDVIVASEFGRNIQRLSATGDVVWRIDLSTSWPRSVCLADGVLYYTAGAAVVAADPATGATLRTFALPAVGVFANVAGDTMVVGYDMLNEQSVEVFQIPTEGETLLSLYQNPHAAGHPRHGFVRDGLLFVADTHRHEVYAIDMATGEKVFALDVYYPNAIEPLDGTELLIVEEHGDRVFAYDYVSGMKRLLLSSPVTMYADLTNGRDYLGSHEASVARYWRPGHAVKSASAIQYAGPNTLYAPNFATRVGPDSYLVSDTDNHRVALFVNGVVVSSLVNLNGPAQAIFVGAPQATAQ